MCIYIAAEALYYTFYNIQEEVFYFVVFLEESLPFLRKHHLQYILLQLLTSKHHTDLRNKSIVKLKHEHHL